MQCIMRRLQSTSPLARRRNNRRMGAALGLLLAGILRLAHAQDATAHQDNEVLTQRVAHFVSQALEPLADPGDTPTITVGVPRSDRLAACDDPTPFLPPGTRLRTSLNVGVRCAAPVVWTTYVPVTVSLSVTYYVAARAIPADQPIVADDLAPRTVTLDRLPPAAVRDPAQLIGLVATNRVNAGQPVKAGALRDAQSVMRGQKVRVTAVGSGFSVSSEGQALATAAPGAMVQVRTASGQLITGIVRHAGLVEVSL